MIWPGHYTARWNAFVASFPFDRIGECPTWRLLNVIDAPTFPRVEQFIDRRRTAAGSPPIGKENYRYRVSSSQCGTDRACAVRHAAACAGGFGPEFIVERDPERGRIEIDPAWWLTHYDYPSDAENPFKQRASTIRCRTTVTRRERCTARSNARVRSAAVGANSRTRTTTIAYSS